MIGLYLSRRDAGTLRYRGKRKIFVEEGFKPSPTSEGEC
jgi:hypothetical protein